MSVYESDNGTFRYDFWKGRRQSASGYKTRKEAKTAENKRREELRKIALGIDLDLTNAPTFTDWAGVLLATEKKRGNIQEESTVEDTLRMVLRFFGHKPAVPDKKNPHDRRTFKDLRPYHGLTLADPMRDATWITRFEDHMEARGISGATKNKQRSAVSKMYALAMEPEFRQTTGVTRNPFVGIHRDVGRKRYTVFDSAEALVAVMDAAQPHVKLAMEIALFAPKFRRVNILSLDWSKGKGSRAWLNEDMTLMMDTRHKTFHHTGLPVVSNVSPDLKKLLVAARKRQIAKDVRLSKRYGRKYCTCNRVIQWEGKAITRIEKGVKMACIRAGVEYGLATGVTFHTFKHEAGTQIAQLRGTSGKMQQALTGHSTPQASQIYTHLVPVHERADTTALGRQTAQRLLKARRRNSGGLPGDFSGSLRVIRGGNGHKGPKMKKPVSPMRTAKVG